MNTGGKGVIVLVLGILSWIGLGLFTSIPGWIIANSALRSGEWT